MADHFLAKSRVNLTDCLPSGDGLAIERFETLSRILDTGAGAAVARLFAEPLISRGNDVASPTIAWYTEFEGEGVPFSELDEDARSELGDVLSRRLATLPDLITDDEDGALLAAALHTLTPDSVWSVGGRPVILNWGMLPEEARTDDRARQRHFRTTLGRFLDIPAPPIGGDLADWSATRKAAAVGVATAGVAALATAGPAAADARTAKFASEGPPPASPPPTPVPAAGGRLPLIAWLPLVLLLVLSGAVLAWLLVPGTRLFAAPPPAPLVTDAEAARLAGSVNEALRARIAALEKALDGAVCQADGTLLMPEGITIEGMLPPSPQTPMQAQGNRVATTADPILPAALTRLIAGADGTEPRTLLQTIEARTVMVLVRSERGITAGTGFVVGPGSVVTNLHVVDGALPDGIHVINNALGTARPAEMVKTSGPFEQTGKDFALLRVADMDLPAFQIYVPDAPLKGLEVFAAGYPGDTLATDAEFKALRAGATDAVPALIVTDGTVNLEPTLAQTARVIEHSAPISKGNSGGPLVDACGRLVGVNTFVRRGSLRDLNFAQSAPDLVAFLQNTPAITSVVTQACTPEILRPSVRSAANAEPPQTTSTPVLPKLVKPAP
ncbi:serine protease [Tropicimonas sp. IMCC34043]|uniref:S1 family peptidase n=1 Tax=Tropicimonas sp. IMCC34043 TaxID=2248760 RepID=UPI000E24F646|nr:serine protease [Tropicimonas sp. IMCC34043]